MKKFSLAQIESFSDIDVTMHNVGISLNMVKSIMGGQRENPCSQHFLKLASFSKSLKVSNV